MLGRKDYTRDELDRATAAVERQLAAYRALAEAIAAAQPDPEVTAALEELEPVLFDNMVLVLDRYFVHRIRAVAGKDGNPLNEVELLATSLIDGDGALQGSTVIKLVPEKTVLGLAVGDRIRLSAAQFEQLAKAFLAELEARFLEVVSRREGARAPSR